MAQSLKKIFESINSELTYRDYLVVIDAIELKYALTESLELPIESYISFVLENKLTTSNILLEWTFDDISNKINQIKLSVDKTQQKSWDLAFNMLNKFKSTFGATIDGFINLGTELKVDLNDIFNALKNLDMYEALKASIKTIGNLAGNTFTTYSTAYKELSISVFGGIDKTKIGETLRKSTTWLQDKIDENPKTKIILGPLVAGVLYYIWTQMTFKGDFIYDFDWSTSYEAIKGNVDLVSLFSGEEGIELITWFITGAAKLVPTTPWLDGALSQHFKGLGNHLIAILVTFLIILHKRNPEFFNNNKIISGLRQKLCARNRSLEVFHNNNNMKALSSFAIKNSFYKKTDIPACI